MAPFGVQTNVVRIYVRFYVFVCFHLILCIVKAYVVVSKGICVMVYLGIPDIPGYTRVYPGIIPGYTQVYPGEPGYTLVYPGVPRYGCTQVYLNAPGSL